MNRYLLLLVKLSISIAILVYLFNQDAQVKNFQFVLQHKKNWTWIGLGFLACIVGYLVSFFRWYLMVKAVQLPITYLNAIKYGFIGIFFNVFAFGVLGGDTMRAYYVTRKFKNRKSEAIASVLADRAIGMLSMFIIASIAYLLVARSFESLERSHRLALEIIGRTLVTVTLIGLVGLAVIALTPRISKTKWFKSVASIRYLGPVLKKIVAVVALYQRQRATIGVAFLLSFLFNGFILLCMYWVAAGLFPNNPTLAEHTVIEPIALVSNAVPLPGGVGGMEFAMDLLYRAAGFRHGLVVAIGVRLCLLAASGIGGLIWSLNREPKSPNAGTAGPATEI